MFENYASKFGSYKSGSIVLFRDDLIVGDDYNGITFLIDMKDKQGSIWFIDEFDESDNTFTLIGDKKGFWYSTDMLSM